MFNGFKILNSRYIYLFLDNNYEFADDINTKNKKQNKIIEECVNYLNTHNLPFNDRIYFVSNGIVIGYLDKNKLNF
ncbi:MAG: hypothetical protein J6B64_00265 [Bacilli bacterium]|nr:hypothetical protein [Bacilli bacterium]MBP3635565.1 hypothetical protein [Bacilli bacterium]